MKDLTKGTCPDCYHNELRWQVFPVNRSPVQNGLLSLHDVGVVLALGCEHCSATVKTLDGDALEHILNQ